MQALVILITAWIVLAHPAICPAETDVRPGSETFAEETFAEEADRSWESAWYDFLVSSLRNIWGDDDYRGRSETRVRFLPSGASAPPGAFPLLQPYYFDEDRSHPELQSLAPGAAVRFERDQSHPWWIELGGRWAPDPNSEGRLSFDEDAENLSIFHLSGGIALQDRISLFGGVETAFGGDSGPAADINGAARENDGPSRSFFLNLQIRY